MRVFLRYPAHPYRCLFDLLSLVQATYAKLVQVEHQVKEQRSLSDEHFDATNLSCSEDKEDASKVPLVPICSATI